MKQVLQDLKSGTIQLADVPRPALSDRHVLTRTHTSLVSTGTERMLVEFGRANLVSKALQQPERVKEVLTKMSTDGVLATLNAVQSKLDTPLALGYSNVGTVVESLDSKRQFKKGDRVVSNGHHAQFVTVPQNLVAKIPDEVTDEQASFTVVGAIALQSVRLLAPTLGECVAVSGLGLIGLLTIQILKANGCRVIGLDYDQSRLDIAASFGVTTINLTKSQNPVAEAVEFSRGRGIDGVIVAASTKSNDPIHQAASMSRKRGRIVLVGVVGMEINRSDFYEKELSFQVSCSYGPGRYDAEYEDQGNDYPHAYVRWTEQRNFEAFLDLMASSAVDVTKLITHRFSIEAAQDAYHAIAEENPLAILFDYSRDKDCSSFETAAKQTLATTPRKTRPSGGNGVVVFGAGNFAQQVLLTAFKEAGAELQTICSKNGVSARHAAERFGIANISSNTEEALQLSDSSIAVIATPHHVRADLICAALDQGKHVFVEKPLAITQSELDRIAEAHEEHPDLLLTVGFNRRFSRFSEAAKSALSTQRPATYIYTINAGPIPPDHWIQDPNIGGGRIIGEVCHFVDLIQYLDGTEITAWEAVATPSSDQPSDNISLLLQFTSGSIATIHYLSSGNKAFPKERLEIFCDGAILTIDNFRKLQSIKWRGLNSASSLQQDKGHKACAGAFIDAAISGAANPVPFEQSLSTSRLCAQVATHLDV